ncbi:MAG: amino acid permease [Burkholderiales bacterium]|nr:amino acid permease [Burkholderiales bacterium]
MLQSAQAAGAPAVKRPGLGTFAGVFTPSILTILGIILFLRLGYVVGHSGLARTLAIIAVAHAVSLLTSLSLSAIATNLRVKGGGDYYLISRTLGVSFGGAIGLVLFLAQAVSVGFYCIGFAEAVGAWLPERNELLLREIGGGAVLALGLLAWLGSDWATRFQYVVMVAITAAIGVFAVGALGAWNMDTLAANWRPPAGHLSFWVAFAIFFPAVTGFTQGVSMSGDLADAGRSIPRGVLWAVGLSLLIYVGAAVLFAAALPNAELSADYDAMQRVASYAPLVVAGVLAATLSSALASFLGAPRILQSLSADGIFPVLKPFAAGSGTSNNPRRGVLLTFVIAAAVVALGDLNAIASLVSMFFLLSYGLLNYATYFEARTHNPSFRPRFRYFDQRASLVGALLCGGAMLAIDLSAGAIAVTVLFGIYQYLEHKAAPGGWADSRRSSHLQQARKHLLAAAAEPEHPRDWRPQLLVFSDTARRRQRLVQFASWIEGGSGLTTVVRVLQGQGAEMIEQRKGVLEELAEELRESKSTAFPLVVTGAALDPMLSAIVQAAGIGPLRANTVVANWIEDASTSVHALGVNRFGQNLRTAFRLGSNLLILDGNEQEWSEVTGRPASERVIDVWWRPNPTGELMLLLAHLVTRSHDWEGAQIRLLAAPEEGENKESASAALKATLKEFRIEARFEVIDHLDAEAIAAHSRDSSLVFLPFGIHGGRFYGPAGGDLRSLLQALPLVAMTMAAQDVDLDADPDIDPENAPDQPAGQVSPG